jgi:4-hydroxyphenylpyruvate dioxygenase
MGPFPHDAAPATISAANPMGTDGFAFVEYAHPDPDALDALLRRLGFAPVARHRSRDVVAYAQGDITFLVNREADSHAARFTALHGPCAPAMGFRVVDAAHAYRRALELGAEPADPADGAPTLDVPTIKGIGGSLLAFVDRDAEAGMLAAFDRIAATPEGVGLHYIDHLTHNVRRGRMDVWAGFYERLFNFHRIRSFEIEGKLSGLVSHALVSPDGRIRIPINESADDHSQIEEYLRSYRGEGIQHIALGCRDIYASVEALRSAGLGFMPAPPATYYEHVDARVPGHGEDLARLQRTGILIDGEGRSQDGKTHQLLQVFSANVLGPIFFEFIQRKGDDGFGEGNFRALFLSIEEDQIRRGVLSAA